MAIKDAGGGFNPPRPSEATCERKPMPVDNPFGNDARGSKVINIDPRITEMYIEHTPQFNEHENGPWDKS